MIYTNKFLEDDQTALGGRNSCPFFIALPIYLFSKTFFDPPTEVTSNNLHIFLVKI